MGKTYRLRKGREQKTDRTYALFKEGENKKEMVKAKTKLKKSGKKFLEILNSKPVIGALIFIMLSLVSVFASDLIFESGGLSVPNTLVLTQQLNPTTSEEGGIFYNSSLQTLMVYNGTQWDGVSGVPSGAIIGFEGACPTGWTEFTAGRGRYLVGLPSGGTLGATVGTALSNQENRAVGQHNHGATGLTFTGNALAGHNHGISNDAHTHSNRRAGDDASASGGGAGWGFVNSGGGFSNSESSTTGIIINSASAGTPSGSIGGSTANSGSVAGTNAPYVQLRFCKKV